MKFSSAIFIGTAAYMSTAAPLDAAPKSLARRTAPTSYCGLQQYSGVGGPAAKDNLWYLEQRGDGPFGADTIAVDAGTCVMISCTGQAGIRLCLQTGQPDGRSFNTRQLGYMMDNTFHDCYGGAPSADHSHRGDAWAIAHVEPDWTMLLSGVADNTQQNCGNSLGMVVDVNNVLNTTSLNNA